MRLVFLNRDGTARDERSISDWEGGFEGLLFDGSAFGRELGAPGDVDEDGVPDLLVGSQEGLWLLFLRPDGSVREHREIRDSRHGFTDVGRLDGSIACGPRWRDDGTLPLVVGGSAGHGEDELDVLWLLRLQRNGTVARW